MPLRPFLLDLCDPISDRLPRALSALEHMETGDTLLMELNRDPRPLLVQLQPMLERGFSWWIAEEGPETWRVLIAREESTDD